MCPEVEDKPRANVADKILIRDLRQDEIEKAESLVRLAFGTFLRIPDPLENPRNRQMILHRFRNDPKNILAAELNGEMVATNVLTIWGSFAFFGPLTVRP